MTAIPYEQQLRVVSFCRSQKTMGPTVSDTSEVRVAEHAVLVVVRECSGFCQIACREGGVERLVVDGLYLHVIPDLLFPCQ